MASKPRAEATSRTIEYTVDDWCLAKMAEALGHQEDARLFYRRSANYRNLFDRSVGFFRGRKADGSWRSPFVPNALVGDEYTEADAWQYAFGVQHDVPGMISLYGGDEGFIRKLDGLFTADSTIQTEIPDITGLIGQYSQGNEACHHVAYLYLRRRPLQDPQRVRQSCRLLNTPPPASAARGTAARCPHCMSSARWASTRQPRPGHLHTRQSVVNKAWISLDARKYRGRKLPSWPNITARRMFTSSRPGSTASRWNKPDHP